jgi:glutathione reductase (NADPH)
MSTFDFDLFVIGGGSGGVRAARIAAGEGGAKVALAEEYRMGGTCVIRGCVPKKLMVFASEYPQMIADARAYGWNANAPTRNWPAFQSNLSAELDRLEAAYRATLQGASVQVFDQRARLIDAHTIELADGQIFSAQHILIATGGRPFVPDIEGADLGVTSNDIFHLSDVPERVLVVGGGYIASEFASIFHGLGSHVIQAYRGAQILRGFDAEVADHVASAMQARGVTILTQSDVKNLKKSQTGIQADFGNGQHIEVDLILFATGRLPNSKNLGLENLGVGFDANGALQVDGYSQTCVPSIFAVGDVTDRINLTPVAIREGHAFADTVFLGKTRQMDYNLIPSAVFTQPEIGTVGLTEDEAVKLCETAIYTVQFPPMRSLFAGHSEKVFFKLVVNNQSNKVLGCHIVGPNAGEMIREDGGHKGAV